MSNPYFSVQHVASRSNLPATLTQGRLYFIDDEGSIVVNHGNGPVTYASPEQGQTNAANIGTLANLTTTEKSNIVGAVNEVNDIASILTRNGAALHNSIPRGKNLGTTITQAQHNAIANGSFDDIWIGDYWTGTYTYEVTYNEGEDDEETISYTDTVKWLVMDCDYMYGRTKEPSGTVHYYHKEHHVLVMPAMPLYGHAFNSNWEKPGAYCGSDLRETGLLRARALIHHVFGESNLLKYNRLLSSARKFEEDENPSASGKNHGYITAGTAPGDLTIEVPFLHMLNIHDDFMIQGQFHTAQEAEDEKNLGYMPMQKVMALCLASHAWCDGLNFKEGLPLTTRAFWVQDCPPTHKYWCIFTGLKRGTHNPQNYAYGVSPFFLLK